MPPIIADQYGKLRSINPARPSQFQRASGKGTFHLPIREIYGGMHDFWAGGFGRIRFQQQPIWGNGLYVPSALFRCQHALPH